MTTTSPSPINELPTMARAAANQIGGAPARPIFIIGHAVAKSTMARANRPKLSARVAGAGVIACDCAVKSSLRSR